jgi:dephospho-CoA kinase
MRAFGLTGNIGCGKSTVAELFAQYPDVKVFNCDQIAKDVISKEVYRDALSEIVGPEAFAQERVDFAKIAQVIFQNRPVKTRFEEFVHPLVWQEVESSAEKSSQSTINIVESAIIFETRSESRFTSVILAVCNNEEQERRLRKNRGMSLEEIRSRQRDQLPSVVKENRAQFVIHTDCTLEELGRRVKILFDILRRWNENTHSSLPR